ncbi:MAG: signal recognition particle-docking protein FtsY [Gammaproteobacteria bacterium]|nr:signal recognition particle-docking protein FtsY [Gammaproteobacteria bacterium]
MPPRPFGRLRAKLGRTPRLIEPDKVFDAETLETNLLLADVGAAIAAELVAAAEKAAGRGGDAAVTAALRDNLENILAPFSQPLLLDDAAQPFVILVTGINGSGKTTTIAKLAHRLRAEGNSVMLAACDTFRAAAVEQLQVWGERGNVPVIAQRSGSDPAAVAFDAWQAARARNVDVLIVDTAGRLHTQGHLMDELAKIRRVLGRKDAAAPHETLLVLDGTTGRNALAQARQFTASVRVSGLIITKLDGSAKGGAVVAIARELALPVRYLGLGEGIEDLTPFDAQSFASALLGLGERDAA